MRRTTDPIHNRLNGEILVQTQFVSILVKRKFLSQSEGTLLTTKKDGIEVKAPLITARRKHAIKFIMESHRAIARTGGVFLLIPRNARLPVYLFKTNLKVIARLKPRD